MKLSKRTNRLILPVILASYLLAGIGVYSIQKNKLLELEQAQLDLQLTELQSSFDHYALFATNYLYNLTQSDILKRFVSEHDDYYRAISLTGSMQQALSTLSRQSHSDLVSLLIISPEGEVLYDYLLSDDPFSQTTAEEMKTAQNFMRSGANRDLMYLRASEDLFARIAYSIRLDPNTLDTPIESQLGKSLLLQLAISPKYFEQLRQQLEQDFLSKTQISTEPAVAHTTLFGQTELLPGLFMSISPSQEVISPKLSRLRNVLLVSVLLLSLFSYLLLQRLLRRFITDPIRALEEEVSMVMDGKKANISYSDHEDEIGSLMRSFNKLYGQLARSFDNTRNLATRDSLTQLPNRHYFTELAHHALLQAEHQNSHVALLYIDLDNFKYVNDKYGHESGDALLKAFAARLSCLLHSKKPEADGQQKDAELPARLAGDEFAALLPALPTYEEAETAAVHIAQRILAIFENGFQFEKGTFPVTASVGISVYPNDGHNLTQLVSNADAAMYQAKTSGKNQLAWYSKELAMAGRRSRDIETALRTCDPDKEFRLVFMPIFCVRTNRISSCETLLRWHSEQLGEVYPDEFIPIAESCGLFDMIDRWVFCNALDSLYDLQMQFGHRVCLAINLSSAQLKNESIFNFLCENLSIRDLAPWQIELEITETFAAEPDKQAVQLLTRLRSHGFKISIDDFGSGYTSLLQLIEYPIDKVKLDRKFLMHLRQSERSGMLKPLIELCHSQNIEVTAEGIEDHEQARFMSLAKCDYLQGYLISKPLPLLRMQPQNIATAAPAELR